ncbi:unnamed protein product [Prunus armeniaca]
MAAKGWGRTSRLSLLVWDWSCGRWLPDDCELRRERIGVGERGGERRRLRFEPTTCLRTRLCNGPIEIFKFFPDQKSTFKPIKILLGLPQKYDPIVSVIEETKDLSTLSIEEVFGSLKGFDRRLNRDANDAIETAFQKLSLSSAKSRHSSSSQGKDKADKDEKEKKNKKWEGNSNVEEKKNYEKGSNTLYKCKICDKPHSGECWLKGKVKCFKCNRFGHMQLDGTYKGNEQAHYVEEQGGDGNMFYVCHAASEQQEDNVWFVDNGCSNHMNANKKLLCDIDTSKTTQVKMGNGDLVDTKRMGSIAIKKKKGRMFI